MQCSAKNKVVKNNRRDARNIAENLKNRSYKKVHVSTNEDIEVKEIYKDDL